MFGLVLLLLKALKALSIFAAICYFCSCVLLDLLCWLNFCVGSSYYVRVVSVELVMASLEDFLKEPSEELLEVFTKDQLLQLSSHYDIPITSSEKRLKDSVK